MLVYIIYGENSTVYRMNAVEHEGGWNLIFQLIIY